MKEIDMIKDPDTLWKLNHAAGNDCALGRQVKSVDWSCPSLEEDRLGMSDSSGIHRRNRLILPARQNLEAAVYGSRIQGKGTYSLSSPYCVRDLDQIQDMDYDLLSDPMIWQVIHSIAEHKEEPLILQVEAPFSILAALMNPMDLYLCMEDGEQVGLLIQILHQIADSSAEYIRACLEAGCRIISLADPVGTMDLVGEKWYGSICGESGIYLMKRCQPYLKNSIIHICRKMSLSLILADLAEIYPYRSQGNIDSHMDILKEMADNPEILYTGMTCIHNEKPDLRDSCIIVMK